ncbi:small integral membrane protein 20-like [Daphnia carinata]|uniref:small integral membrane protein 20-like n=1 Tax=Daphnia carinata TaxID=120202 RepID=UPI00257E602E|nr:small integral membrane protein 20-like [Daphnia carinata]
MVLLKGWKYAAMVSSVIGVIGLAIYPIIVSPMINPEPYKKQQSVNRRGIKQEEVQPGNMKVWSDPFGRPKEAFEK